MPDAARYGDAGADTLGHIHARQPLQIPNLRRLGIGHLHPALGGDGVAPEGAYGRCAMASEGKDTTTGHWEMAGIVLEPGFPTYPRGFPPELIATFEARIGRRTLGNIPASGTEIIERLGAEHVRTGAPIVYTSADSVFQVAAHEDVIPVADLYRICAIARELLAGPHRVGRVIARPFDGPGPGRFQRTRRRHDYAVPPPEGMLLDRLAAADVPVLAVGKISDIFLGRGIQRNLPMESNAHGMALVREALGALARGLIFANLVDFDMLYGHRNDVPGFAAALEAFDSDLGRLRAGLADDDLLLITADHGCDPTTASTDHSREYIPLLASAGGIQSVDLGTRQTLADIGQTVADNFGVPLAHGASFLPALRPAPRPRAAGAKES